MYYGSQFPSAGPAVRSDADMESGTRDTLAPAPSGAGLTTAGSDGAPPFWRTDILQHIYDGVLMTDLSGTIVDATERAAHLFRTTVSSLLGSSLHELMKGAGRAFVDHMYGSLRHDQFSVFQTTVDCLDGSRFGAEIAGVILNFEELRYCFFVRDISGREDIDPEASTVIAAVKSSASEKREDKPKIAAAISQACHSIGQPTTVLFGNLTLLGEMIDNSNSEAAELLKECMKATEKVAEIIHSLRRVAD
jgi:PAS domain S-box-containing protein